MLQLLADGDFSTLAITKEDPHHLRGCLRGNGTTQPILSLSGEREPQGLLDWNQSRAAIARILQEPGEKLGKAEPQLPCVPEAAVNPWAGSGLAAVAPEAAWAASAPWSQGRVTAAPLPRPGSQRPLPAALRTAAKAELLSGWEESGIALGALLLGLSSSPIYIYICIF